MSSPSAGIASLGLSLPPLALPVADLATIRGQEPAKFTVGLGCGEMALCPPGHGVVEMASQAAERAFSRWSGERERIGLVAVGTETAVDMSRPLSAWVADNLGLSGPVRSYEVKHACYGGTVALRQALEWKLSGAAGDRAALVIAADVALYALKDPGEPTQGAGAVAMIVDDETVEDGLAAAVDLRSHAWSEPAFDFWRPVGESFPRVDGQFSLDCYKRAAENCFKAWVEAGGNPDELAAVCYHVPFPKMVKKAALHVAETMGWDEERAKSFYDEKIDPFMDWNRRVGNAYTASLWMAVAQALAGRSEGERLAAFSYGSGFGSELLQLTAGPTAAAGLWRQDIEADLADREIIDTVRYGELRQEELQTEDLKAEAAA